MVTAVLYHDIKKQTLTGGSADRGLRLTVNGAGSSTQAFWPLENKWISRGLACVLWSACDGRDHSRASSKTSMRTEAGRTCGPGTRAICPHSSSTPTHPRASPAVTVSSVHVNPEVQQEPYDMVVPSTDGVVQGGDALVIGLTGVLHLQHGTWHVSPAWRCQGR